LGPETRLEPIVELRILPLRRCSDSDDDPSGFVRWDRRRPDVPRERKRWAAVDDVELDEIELVVGRPREQLVRRGPDRPFELRVLYRRERDAAEKDRQQRDEDEQHGDPRERPAP